jgi:hypothetical protein
MLEEQKTSETKADQMVSHPFISDFVGMSAGSVTLQRKHSSRFKSSLCLPEYQKYHSDSMSPASVLTVQDSRLKNEQGILGTFFSHPQFGAWLSRSEQTPRDPSIGLRAGTKSRITFQLLAANHTITMVPYCVKCIKSPVLQTK